MLGKRIRYLRRRQGLTRETLAERAGVSVEELAAIEENGERLPPSQLVSIADGLHLRKAAEFTSLLALNGLTRRFQAYCLGVARTGTKSISGIFGNYRSAHEFWQRDVHQLIVERNQGRVSRSDLVAFIHDRDGAGCLEMDSAHFHRYYVDVLVEAFPEARFICLIRDCYSWLDSVINFFTLPHVEALWTRELENGIPFPLSLGDCEAKREWIRNFERHVDVPLAHWAATYQAVLAKLPPERSLVIRTHEIDDGIARMAELVGVAPDTMLWENRHLHKSIHHTDALRCCDVGFLQEKCDRHCGELMAEYYPGYAFEDYLEGNPIPAQPALS